MQNFVQSGDVVNLTLAAAAASGDFVMIGTIGGVAATDGAIGDVVACKRCGVFDLTKTAAQAWAQGAKIYYNSDTGEMTTTATGNTLVGAAAAAAVNPSAIGSVLLDGAIR